MKNLIVIFLAMVAALILVRSVVSGKAEMERFQKRETLVAEATECLESGEWNCAEKAVRELLCDAPHDTNLQMHLAIILYEQERYEECRKYIASLGFKNHDLEMLDMKVASLIREMAELGIERSMHFRVEFEGDLPKRDIMEALAVLEVAYDSLCRLFDFHPENKMHLVLYESAQYQGVGPRPEWVGAVYDGKLRIPVNVMQYREIYRPMFFHELTHAFVRAMAWNKVPLWINEGIAQVIDASRTGMPRPEGGVPDLGALTEPFVNENNTSNAVRLYWYSQRMVEQILRRDANFVHFREFLQSLRHGEADESLQKFYGVTAAQLLDEVR